MAQGWVCDPPAAGRLGDTAPTSSVRLASRYTIILARTLTYISRLFDTRSLLDNDCIDFLGFLETIFSLRHSYDPSRAKQSAWLSTDAGSRMLELARGRAYVRTKVVKSKVLDEDAEAELVMQEMEAASLRPAQSAEERAAAEAKTHRARGLPVGVEPVLEEQPKSSLLADILAEVETELHQASMQGESVIKGGFISENCRKSLTSFFERLQTMSPTILSSSCAIPLQVAENSQNTCRGAQSTRATTTSSPRSYASFSPGSKPCTTPSSHHRGGTSTRRALKLNRDRLRCRSWRRLPLLS